MKPDQLITPTQYARRLAAHIMSGCRHFVGLPHDAQLRLLDDLELNRLGSIKRVKAPVRNY